MSSLPKNQEWEGRVTPEDVAAITAQLHARVATLEAERDKWLAEAVAQTQEARDLEAKWLAESKQHERLQRIYLAPCEATRTVEAERDTLREALEWYAEHHDEGERARAALSGGGR